ncbi:plasmid pRiA4b ORF-3 family protein [Magnetovibrio blakemorei]|uniref:Plasmid pRiA4b Orf3-like domain-containing protein n=1 Tax=Magnetovibrio blakemorei TaxID=28181 RepID=A0A1E5Q2Y9_9PROT|nr:plasmid pRiA4b ORF-3 family protein [Magnetovibrio blakemorei]OEJ63862.1 hypothetical protein BEN30_17050 [Magnetovibrio blakemorei]
MALSITLHIRLTDIEPEIWRQVCVPADYTLAGLHFVIQAVMGWEDEHLHLFIIDGNRYGVPEDASGGRPISEEGNVRLSHILMEGETFLYVYDFGDDWRHEIKVESIGSKPTELRCLDGKRACPPEDSGGPYAYSDLVEAVRSPKSADPEFLDWVGDFDPEKFDQDLANKRLKALTSSSRH